jgi:hypothetical protein
MSKIVNFEDVKITTMTVIVLLEGNVNIESAFPLLPITRLELKETKSTKNFKIPWPGKEYAGSIFSVKFSGITRGLIKSSKEKSFRNSVGIEICTSGKNISAKLSKNKIHMCGSNSEALAKETAQHIVNHLINIQKELDYISEHVSERDEVIRWLIKETKGEPFIINEETQEIIDLEKGETIRNSVIYDKDGNIKYNYKELNHIWEEGDSVNSENILIDKYGQLYRRTLTKKEKKEGITEYPFLSLNEAVKISNEKEYRIFTDEKGGKINKIITVPFRILEVTSVKIPNSISKGLKEENRFIYNKNINSRIANFLIHYIQDYAYHHVLTGFLNNFKEIENVYTEKEISHEDSTKFFSNEMERKKLPLSVGDLNIAMINYSYSLKMNVDRWKLTQLIDGYKGTFNATYNNTTDHHVTISVPYIAQKDEVIKRKSQNNCISFMIYRSGIVTQSGPSPALMSESYYDFMKFINEHRNEICIKDGKPVSLKFKPTSSEDYLQTTVS